MKPWHEMCILQRIILLALAYILFVSFLTLVGPEVVNGTDLTVSQNSQ